MSIPGALNPKQEYNPDEIPVHCLASSKQSFTNPFTPGGNLEYPVHLPAHFGEGGEPESKGPQGKHTLS